MTGDFDKGARENASNTSGSTLDPSTATSQKAKATRKRLIKKLKKGAKEERQQADLMARCRKGKRCDLAACPVCKRLKIVRAKSKKLSANNKSNNSARETQVGETAKKTTGTIDVQLVRVKDVLVTREHEDLDYDLVDRLAESFEIHGQIHPIAVRLVREEAEGKPVDKIVLVAGKHRLQAAKISGSETIEARFIDGDENDARLIEASENLWRKNLSVLANAELMTKWIELVRKKGFFTGQNVAKRNQGRPLGEIGQAARELPVHGTSLFALLKRFQRAKTIAGIDPEAKDVVKSAGLDNHQNALLQIAKAGTRKAQIKKAQELATRLQESIGDEQADSASDTSLKAGDEESTTSSGKEGQSARSHSDSNVTESGDDQDTIEDHKETTYDALEEAWKRDCKQLYAYAPFAVREQFDEMLRRARCKAKGDIVAFVRDVFRGRKRVFTKQVYALAKKRGFTQAQVQRVVHQLGYKKGRLERDPNSPWFYRNRNANWKEEHVAIPTADLEAALAAEEVTTDEPEPRQEPGSVEKKLYEIG